MGNVKVKKRAEIEEEHRKRKEEEHIKELSPSPEERIEMLEQALLFLTLE